MDIAEILLFVSILLIIVDILSIIIPKTIKWDFKISPGSIGGLLIVASYALLLFYFVSNNFLYDEVQFYSSSSLSIVERIYATWASSKGSWLLMTSFFALGSVILRLKTLKASENKKSILFIDLFLIAFLIILVAESPFTLASASVPDGQGLNPLLLSPWMIIHPLIIFIGYDLILLSFATTIDTLGKSSAPVYSKVMAQIAWLFMTLGIVLGGIWAYVVLGWGGYWAWDPVETASLLPWLALTAYFHMTRDTFKATAAKEFLLMIASGLVLFAGAVTRGGFVSSVHAFGFSYAGVILTLLLVTQTAYSYFAIKGKDRPLLDFNINTASVYSLSLALSFISLVIITIISTWGLVLPIIQQVMFGTQTAVGSDFFTKWIYAPTILFALSLIGCQTSVKLNYRQFVAVVGVALVMGVALMLLKTPSNSDLANLGLPSLLISSIFVLTGLIPLKGRVHTIPRGLIHLGVVLILIGVFVSSSMKIDNGIKVIAPGSTIKNSGVEVTFGNFTVIEPFGSVYYRGSIYPQAAGIQIPVHVRNGGVVTDGVIKAYYYTLNGVVAEPYVALGVDDAYITIYVSDQLSGTLNNILNGGTTAPPHVSVSMVINPLVNLIWFGSLIMCIGIVSQMIVHPIKVLEVPIKPNQPLKKGGNSKI